MNDDSLKSMLRIEARRHRARVDTALENPEEAARVFLEKISPKPGQVIAAYWPTGREFDPRPTLEKLLAAGFACALPVINEGSKILDFTRWRDGEPLTQGAHGIMQPAHGDLVSPDILIIPLLAFDRKGRRLGQGGGYYDATLAYLRARKEIVAVGMAYSAQVVLFSLPEEPHDQRLDWVITPQKAYNF